MNFPGDFTSFWHAQIAPGKPCHIVVKPHSDCSITNIALHQDEDRNFPEGTRTVLYAIVNNSSPAALVPFTVGRYESTGVDIRFTNYDDIVLRTEGAEIAIDVVGNFVGEMPFIDNGVPQPQDDEPTTEQ